MLMFTMAKIRDGSTYLKNHLTANDYYCEDECTIGEWIGNSAELLNIQGNTIGKNCDIFEQLRTNINPLTGEQLTQRNVKNRIALYDFQCSAPKSVSIMGSMMEDGKIKEAHYESVKIAFAELEKFASRQIYREGEKTSIITANVVAAKFEHDTSRSLDPQIHTHLVVVNATFCKNERDWYGLETEEMVKAIGFFSFLTNASNSLMRDDLSCDLCSLRTSLVDISDNLKLRVAVAMS